MNALDLASRLREEADGRRHCGLPDELLLEAAECLEARVDATMGFVPGVFRCAKCNFRLLQSYLNAADGTVTSRDTAGEKCPNCSVPLWRVSWKDEAHENLEIAESQINRAIEAEGRVAALDVENSQLRAAMGDDGRQFMQTLVDEASAEKQKRKASEARAHQLESALRAMLTNYGPPSSVAPLCQYPDWHPITQARRALTATTARSENE
jgi:hypothetical protein